IDVYQESLAPAIPRITYRPGIFARCRFRGTETRRDSGSPFRLTVAPAIGARPSDLHLLEHLRLGLAQLTSGPDTQPSISENADKFPRATDFDARIKPPRAPSAGVSRCADQDIGERLGDCADVRIIEHGFTGSSRVGDVQKFGGAGE